MNKLEIPSKQNKTKLNSASIGKCAVLFLLSGFWLLITINSAYRDFSYNDKLLIFSWVSLICAFQFLFLLTAIRIKFSEWTCNVFFAIFAIINLFCLYLFFINNIAGLSPFIQAALFLFSLFIAHQFFASLSIGGRWMKGVIGIAGVLFSVNVAWFIGQSYPAEELPPVLAEGKTSSPKIKIVDFQQKPNVYFISFDAMIPETLAKKYMNIDNLPYQDFMVKNGFRRFRNAFSDGFSTRFSLNQLLAMEYDYFETLTKQNKHLGLFTGLSPSPAFEIFKANGYKTNTYFISQYMGYETGPHVDNHKVAYDDFYFVFCENHPTVNAAYFGFFGFCLLSWNSLRVRDFFADENLALWYNWSPSSYADVVLEDFTRQLPVDNPFISFMHIISPNHTPRGYFHTDSQSFSKYRESFLHRSTDETTVVMEKIFNFIRVNDPNAYIYFYSDHGQWLSWAWGVSYKGFRDLNKEDREFYIQDRYGILAAFYPPDACAEYFDAPMMKPFVTNAMVLRQIIRCLADGEDPVISPVEYNLQQTSSDTYQGDEPGYYEDYLYE